MCFQLVQHLWQVCWTAWKQIAMVFPWSWVLACHPSFVTLHLSGIHVCWGCSLLLLKPFCCSSSLSDTLVCAPWQVPWQVCPPKSLSLAIFLCDRWQLILEVWPWVVVLWPGRAMGLHTDQALFHKCCRITMFGCQQTPLWTGMAPFLPSCHPFSRDFAPFYFGTVLFHLMAINNLDGGAALVGGFCCSIISSIARIRITTSRNLKSYPCGCR